VNEYVGSEIPGCDELGLDPARRYALFRDPEELRKAVPSFNNLPLLRRHLPVDATNYAPDDVIGATGFLAAFDGESLTNSLVVWAAPAIRDIERGVKKALSCAYRYVAIPESGSYKGRRYEIRMTKIAANHVALVESPRVDGIVVGDSKPTGSGWRLFVFGRTVAKDQWQLLVPLVEAGGEALAGGEAAGALGAGLAAGGEALGGAVALGGAELAGAGGEALAGAGEGLGAEAAGGLAEGAEGVGAGAEGAAGEATGGAEAGEAGGRLTWRDPYAGSEGGWVDRTSGEPAAKSGGGGPEGPQAPEGGGGGGRGGGSEGEGGGGSGGEGGGAKSEEGGRSSSGSSSSNRRDDFDRAEETSSSSGGGSSPPAPRATAASSSGSSSSSNPPAQPKVATQPQRAQKPDSNAQGARLGAQWAAQTKRDKGGGDSHSRASGDSARDPWRALCAGGAKARDAGGWRLLVRGMIP